MRKFAKIFVALVAAGSLMFVGTSPAFADNSKKPAKGSSVSSTHKGDKADKADKKAKKTKKTKKNKKAKKAKKSAKAKNGKRIANFAPIIDPTSDPQTCDPMIDKQCQLVIDPSPEVDPTCDPAVDVWCEVVVDPTCDPAIDVCDPIVDPTPTEEPTVDPTPTEEPTVDPTPTEEPTVDPYPIWENNSEAWKTYFASVEKANREFNDFIATAQADFDTATAEAKANRDEAIASATSFADVVKAVKEYRLATAEQQAKLQEILNDAYQALSILNQKAYDQLIADGGLIPIKCWDRGSEPVDVKTHVDPMPPAPETADAPAPLKEGKHHNGHHKRHR